IVGREYEHKGIAKDGAKMVHAVANVDVPKLTLIIGGSFGAGNYGMWGGADDPRVFFFLAQARNSLVGGGGTGEGFWAVKIQQKSRAGEKLSPSDIQALRQPILEKYAKESSAYYSSARLWDDGIIDPRDTRKVLGMALMATAGTLQASTKFGTFRM